MMSYNPQRIILESVLSNPDIGIVSSMIRPQYEIGYRFIKPQNENPFNKGNVLFGITMTCNITFSPQSFYKFSIRSIIEIIDNKKPLATWALEMLSDEELKYFENALNEDIRKKNIQLSDKLTPSFESKNIESEIDIALKSFLEENKV